MKVSVVGSFSYSMGFRRACYGLARSSGRNGSAVVAKRGPVREGGGDPQGKDTSWKLKIYSNPEQEEKS